MREVVSETSFVVYHEDFRQDFMIRQVAANEDIGKWIDMPSHSNIVIAFDQFVDRETGLHFQMTELHNGGDVYDYIAGMDIDLSLDVSRNYREFVFDVAI